MSGMFLSDLHVLTNLTLSCEVGNIINQIKKETGTERCPLSRSEFASSRDKTQT